MRNQFTFIILLSVFISTFLYSQAPTLQATNIVISNINTNTALFESLIPGDGHGRAAFIKLGSSVGSASPVDGTEYALSQNYGEGSQIGESGWYRIFDPTNWGDRFSINNLQPNTTYTISVCEYYGSGAGIVYNTSTSTNNPIEFTTLGSPSVQATNIVISNINTNTALFESLIPGDGHGRAAFIKLGSSVGSASPVDGTEYALSQNYGEGSQIGESGWYRIFDPTNWGDRFSINNLQPNTTYTISVCEYYGSGAGIVYNTSTSTNNPIEFTTLGSPSVQATNIVISNINTNTALFESLIPGDGHGRAAFIKLGSSVGSASPVDGTEYALSQNYGEGSQIGESGWYRIFDPTNWGDRFSINNLQPNTTYTISVCEYYGSGAGIVYNTSTSTNNPIEFTTLGSPSVQATNIVISNINTNTALFESLIPGDGHGRAAFIKLGSSVGSASPVDGTEYALSQNYGEGSQIGESGWYRIFDPTNWGDRFSINNLQPNTTYTISVCEYYGSGAGIVYNTSTSTNNPIEFTTRGAPSIQATEVTTNWKTTRTANISWTRGNGDNSIVFIKEGNAGTAIPVNVTNYTANTTFSSGSQIGSSGWFCIYKGTENSTSVFGLNPETDYQVHSCEYNGGDGGEAYNVSSASNNPHTFATEQEFVDPVVYLPFNGNADDESGNNNDGINNGAVLTSDVYGNPNSAYYFYESSISTTTTNFPFHDEPRTLMCWVKPDQDDFSTGGFANAFIGYGMDDCVGKMFGIGNFETQFWGGCNDMMATPLPPEEWTSVVVTFSPPRSINIWLNGQKYSYSLNSDLNTVQSLLWIGAETIDNGASFRRYANVSIDEIKVYNRVLSDEEIINSTGIWAPSTQASNILINSLGTRNCNISWSRGSGQNLDVFVKQTNAGAASPSINTTYSADETFGNGDQIGSTGWYCVYNGNGTTTIINGLQPNTQYQIHCCEYNGSLGKEDYLSITSDGNPITITTTEEFVNPIAYYPFNGNTNDASGNGRNAVYNGATLTTDKDGVDEQAYYFDGTESNYMLFDYQFPFHTEMNSALAFWINIEGGHTIIWTDGNNSGSGNRLQFYTWAFAGGDGFAFDGNGFTSGEMTVPLNEWHNIAIVKEGDIYHTFLDGSPMVTNDCAGQVLPITPSWSIAGRSGLGLIGKIDEIKLWNRALSEAEIVSALPVELSSFTANLNSNDVEIIWKTATEVNNYGFEIERSIDKDNAWEKIGFINGSGNSNNTQDYTLVDHNPPCGKLLYRLKQIDNDGLFRFSKILTVEVALPKNYKLDQNYPNPFNPSTTIRFALPQSTKVKITLYNILGEEVKTIIEQNFDAGLHELNINSEGLSAGVYIYRLQTDAFTAVKKMMLFK